VRVINVRSCETDDTFGRGAFHARVFDLTDRLGASVIGATVWEMPEGAKSGPYHFHPGLEEWLYVVSGAPTLRDPAGERPLEPGELVAFSPDQAGAHTLRGPGRVVIFSAGKRGWGEAWLSVYPDSDKVAAKGGVIFRRADAIESWCVEPDRAAAVIDTPGSGRGPGSPAINLMTVSLQSPLGGALGLQLGARSWAATLYELAPGETTDAYHYDWCREALALVVDGAPTLRHADGQTLLSASDICSFPEGPTGAHQLRNDSRQPARLVVFSSPTGRPMSTFYPEEETVLIQLSDRERLLFRHEDRIEDYWDGEPGAV
jgi:uncharacterized cupin superfamily protein